MASKERSQLVYTPYTYTQLHIYVFHTTDLSLKVKRGSTNNVIMATEFKCLISAQNHKHQKRKKCKALVFIFIFLFFLKKKKKIKEKRRDKKMAV